MDRTSKITKTLGGALLMTACGLVGTAALGGVAAADHECTTETFSWSNPTLSQIATWNSTMATGLSIPAPAAGATLTVVSTAYTAYDSIGEGEVTRAIQNETGEQFTLRVGGTQVGGLSADLPDSVSQGAATPWFSGTVAGSLGGAGTTLTGGEIVIQHSGKSETVNAFSVKTITVVVERCLPHAPTTTAPTTTAPTTTAPATTAPATTAPATTTTVASAGPTTTVVAAAGPTTTVTGGSVTTVPGGSLPVTGGDMTLPLILAALAAGTGAALLIVRRKATLDNPGSTPLPLIVPRSPTTRDVPVATATGT
ncbi:MAG: LPXTG cell wall anchor domain-containing protein, partial [Actinomycetes bacterium]